MLPLFVCGPKHYAYNRAVPIFRLLYDHSSTFAWWHFDTFERISQISRFILPSLSLTFIHKIHWMTLHFQDNFMHSEHF